MNSKKTFLSHIKIRLVRSEDEDEERKHIEYRGEAGESQATSHPKQCRLQPGSRTSKNARSRILQPAKIPPETKAE